MNKTGFSTVAWICFVVVMGVGGYFVLTERANDTKPPVESDQLLKQTSMLSPEQANKFHIYSLDVSAIVSRESGSPETGNLIISHNAVAVFPLDFSSRSRKITEIGPATIFEAQTKSGCWGQASFSGSHEVMRNIAAFGPIQPQDVGNIRKIMLEMPSKASQDDYIREPGTFCIGLRTENGAWAWNTKPTQLLLDDALEGYAEVTVDAKNIDAVAILFDETTVLKTIRFEAAKVR